MLQQKPFILDPIKAAKEGMVLNQTLSFSHLSSLHECIVDGTYDFQLNLKFHFENNKPLLDGQLAGKITLICQRSLEPFEFRFDDPVKLGFVTDDRFFKNFPATYDPYIYKDNQINLVELLEEEILLSIPMIPKKSLNDCQAEQNTSYYGVFETSDTEKQDKPNPFSALKELKFTKKD
ncbi:YceD family protein [Cysteiniphilum sp. JM-1]|uniref:YceD family protein n=1 Tax=Cysteiniphilum sp. JM-1 TaxID=2610891 RepID=UPI001245B71B|nr:YceD family protein [Cysteiniphilum sp. JM-1]